MARRKQVEAPLTDEVAPVEVLRCPVTRWNAGPTGPEAFEKWLRDRQEWRRTHAEPLPGLFARDRHALDHMADQLDPAVVAAEKNAPVAGRVAAEQEIRG